MLLHHEFIHTAKKHGSKLAFVDKTTGKRLSYSQCLIAALVLSKRFSDVEDKYVGVMLPTSAGCGLTILALLFAGKVPVMINYATTAELNLLFARRKCGFRLVITSSALLARIACNHVDGMVYLEDLVAGVTKLEKLGAALLSRLPAATLVNRVAPGSESDTASIMFTTGSEKDPKGVELSHRNILHNVGGMVQAVEVDHTDRLVAVLPLFHVFGFSTCFWLPLLQGMTVITLANPLEVKAVVGAIREERPTILLSTPFFLSGYLRQSQQGDFESLRLIVTGADKTPDGLHKAMRHQHGKEILEGYGATETSPVIAVNRPGNNRPGSVGRPIPGVAVRIAAMNGEGELPAGQEGRILVKGNLVMEGYFGDAELTRERIRDGWYDTGDIGMLDGDGVLWHRGRWKRFVKIGGEMVSLTRIETVAEKLLPEQVECCAVEIPDSVKGARIALALTEDMDVSFLRHALKSELSPLAVPRHFLVVPELPKMGNGKIDFKTVGQMVNQLVAGSSRAEATA